MDQPKKSAAGRGPGRHKKGEKDKQSVVVRARVTPSERELIAQKADASGLSISEFLRRCALRRELPSEQKGQVFEGSSELLFELGRVGKNLNQFARSIAETNTYLREGQQISGKHIVAKLDATEKVLVDLGERLLQVWREIAQAKSS